MATLPKEGNGRMRWGGALACVLGAWALALAAACGISLGGLVLPTGGGGSNPNWPSLGGVGGTVLPAGDCVVEGNPADATRLSVFQLLNDYRQNNGLVPLRYSLRLELAATRHAEDMFQRGFFDHVNPDGDGPGERALDAGFCHEFGGENIATGTNTLTTPQEVMQAWKNSPTHNANMLEPSFRWVGVGVFSVQNGSNITFYWVQHFATDAP